MAAKRSKPKGQKRRNPQSLTVADRKALAAARRVSAAFRGRSEVIELKPKERKLPRFLAVAGKMPEVAYIRGRKVFVHRSGDKGLLAKPGKGKPTLAINPLTKKPVMVSRGSGMKAKGRWLIG